MTSNRAVDTFRRRARIEAERYGSDPWVFVRELLQNARDAGASRVTFTVERDQLMERITCRDDGEGMSFADSRQYLFTLYASSKRQAAEQAGNFGVGFWSILRFQPSLVIVRSRARHDTGWEVRLDGSLEQVEHQVVSCPLGTEIVLQRPTQRAGTGSGWSENLTAQVITAAGDHGRYLTHRDDRSRPLKILVNGKRADAPFGLPPPSVSFRRPGLRGAVGLGRKPTVELFVHGLRVRIAASLDDLLSEEGPAGTALPELPQGLVPQVLLDSDRLEVLLTRADAREDRRLRRYVAAARGELARLVRRQLDRSVPVSLPRRLLESLARLWCHPWRPAASGLLVIAAALLIAWQLAGPLGRHWQLRRAMSERLPAAGGTAADGRLPYSELAADYRGPAVEPLSAATITFDLRYHPPHGNLLFATRLVTAMSEDGQPLPLLGSDSELIPYTGTNSSPSSSCIEVDLGVHAGPGLLRLPVPTGLAIDPESLHLDGEPVVLYTATAGEPVLLLSQRFAGRLFFRVCPAPPTELPADEPFWPPLPEPLALVARDLQTQPVPARVHLAVDTVSSLVSYDRSLAVVRRHRQARQAGQGLFARALAIRAGDCDVQNSLLVALLRSCRVPSRLAIGLVGRNGSAAPGLHAWAEYLDEEGRWQVADASTGGGSLPTADPPAAVAWGGENDAAPPANPRTTEQHRRALRLPAVLWLGAACVLITAGLLATRGRRSLHLGSQTDLAALLRGALRHPETFAQVPTLFSRPTVPLLGGSAASLRQVQRRSAQGKLFRSKDRSPLATRAVERGTPVIDTGTPEGVVVADLLAAADVDHWHRLLAAQQPAAFADRANQVLRQLGECWLIRVATGATEPLTAIDLQALGLGRSPSKLVVLAGETALCGAATALSPHRPWQAVLLVLDAATHHLDLPASSRAHILAEPAARAVAERVDR